MHARVVLGVGKGVLFREVFSVQECPHRERGSTVVYILYLCVCVCLYTVDVSMSDPPSLLPGLSVFREEDVSCIREQVLQRLPLRVVRQLHKQTRGRSSIVAIATTTT